MNKKGNVGLFGLSILVGVVFFMVGMIFVNPINDTITSTRAALNCSASPSTLSSGNMALCLLFDILSPYFIIAIIATVLSVITARLMI